MPELDTAIDSQLIRFKDRPNAPEQDRMALRASDLRLAFRTYCASPEHVLALGNWLCLNTKFFLWPADVKDGAEALGLLRDTRQDNWPEPDWASIPVTAGELRDRARQCAELGWTQQAAALENGARMVETGEWPHGRV